MSEPTKEHIKNLVVNFYEKVRHDDLLSPIFNDIAQVDWDTHIPLLCQFWNSIMLETHEYHGNAYRKHMGLSKKTSLSQQHFQRWLTLFSDEAKKQLPTEAAHAIIFRASRIAEVIQDGVLN